MRAATRLGFACILLGSVPAPVSPGVYEFALDPSFAPSLIMHPKDYVGTGGPISIGVCLSPTSAELHDPLLYAMKVWNNFWAKTVNYTGTAYLPGDFPPGPDYVLSAHSILLHELGHCAFGLDHVNRVDYAPDPDLHTTYTATKNFATMSAGPDGVPGSGDDIVTVIPSGARNVFWFRLEDNNPFLVAASADSTTISRNYQALFPMGQSWPASGNLNVAALLGSPKTQSVMVSQMGSGYDFLYLSGDESNTVRFAMNGLDVTPTSTGDNYSFTLVFESDCANADVEIDFAQTTVLEFAHCEISRAVIPSPGDHYRITPFGSNQRPKIYVTSNPPWPFSFYRFMIFGDGFETGGAGDWSAFSP